MFLALAAACMAAFGTPAYGRKPEPPARQPSVADTAVTFAGKVAGRFVDLYKRGVDEKLYLQTDKPYYSAGDTIWFKGYLVNAVTHQPNMPSRYIYVQMLSASGDQVHFSKIKLDGTGYWQDGRGFCNSIPTTPVLPAGDYRIRAYTQWMVNGSSEFLFNRVVRIVNPLDARFSTDVTYEKADDGKMVANIKLLSGASPIADTRVSCLLYTGSLTQKAVARSDAGGRIAVPFTPAAGRNMLDISIDGAEGETMHASFRLPDFTTDYDLQFLPEGGPLVAASTQKLAFKAVSVGGLSVEAAGKIYNSRDEEVAVISTSHKGMGCVTFAAAAGERYYARVRSADGVEKRFALPAPSAGYALDVSREGNDMICCVTASPGLPLDGLAIVAHLRGKLIAAVEYTPGAPPRISTANLPAGIVAVALVDKATLRTLSQRLLFVPGMGGVKADISTDKPSYDKREKVTVDIKFSAPSGKPVASGSFAVSVTDRSSVRVNSMDGGIESYMLLTSDLRGNIEEPGAYFADRSEETLARLDLLLMTQGWTRFDIKEVLEGRLGKRNYPPETEQTISGRITGFFGGESRGMSLMVLIPSMHEWNKYDLDDKSRFRLTGLDLPQDSKVSLQALRKSGAKSRSLTLEIDPDPMPGPEKFAMPPLRAAQDREMVPYAFINQSRMRLYYENGMRTIDLEAVSVSYKRKVSLAGVEVVPDRTLNTQKLEESYGGLTIAEMLKELMGKREYRLMNNLSNFPIRLMDMDNLYPDQLESIDIISGADAAAVSGHGDRDVVYLTFKASFMGRVPLNSLVHLTPLGYKAPVEFYQPRYDLAWNRSNSIPDVRTTLLWDPGVKPDAAGRATVWFYASDQNATYDIVLEGVTSSGEICRATASVQCK